MGKIPDNAKKVFEGVMFDVYQWEQEMFDGSYETFERLKRPDTVLIIPTQGDRIFFADEEQPDHRKFFSLFGGRIDEGEEILPAAKRELAEESGLVSDDWELLETFSPVFKIEWNMYLYVARNAKTEGKPNLDAGEKMQTKSASLNDFLELLELEKFRGNEIKNYVFRLKQDASKLAEFKQKLFG